MQAISHDCIPWRQAVTIGCTETGHAETSGIPSEIKAETRRGKNDVFSLSSIATL